ncbi:MAG: DUF4331 family protein [Saprospiraceae bacterium]|nr:DUF4331 family protein [Saprospiraceae bacterium]
MKHKKYVIQAIVSLVLYCLVFTNAVWASSHREAPLISSDPLADNVDLYAFRSPDDPNTITIIATYVPMQLPHGGPNYYSFGKNIRYEIHVDNDASKHGDEILYRFTFDVVNEDPTTFFNIRLGKQNQKTTYTLERSLDGGVTFSTIITNGYVPPNNIGDRSIMGAAGLNTAYTSLFQNGITNANSGEKVFAGPVDDPFFVDLGGIFDLGDAPRQGKNSIDGLACLNVSAIAIQVPIATLLKTGAPSTPTSILDSDYVIGVWASASRQAVTTLSSMGEPVYSGDWVQVSRLGMPLTNEAVIPVGDKDFWNSITPYDEIAESTLDKYFYNPELALYMDDDLFGGAVPSFGPLRVQTNSLGAFDFSNGADGLYGLKGNPVLAGTALDDAVFGSLLLPGPGMPRSIDLWPAFHTGVPNVIPYQLATGKGGNPLAAGKPFVNNFLPNGGDMLRLNMAVPPTPRNDPNFSSLGLVQAAAIGLTVAPYNTTTDLEFIPNMDGFPNGRRLEDDVTRIELQAVAGVVLAAVGLWYDDYDPATSPGPVTQDLLNVLSYTTGVEKNDRDFQSSFPYLAMPHNGTGDCSGEIVEPDYVTDPAYIVFISSNNSGKTGMVNVAENLSSSLRTFDVSNADADGIYYDKNKDVLYQLDRTNNVIRAYSKVKENLDLNLAPVLTATSSSDFTNGREIAVYGDKLVVAQDAAASNGSVDKFMVYSIQPSSITFDRTYTVNRALWGIHLDRNTLYAVEDVSDRILRFDNFFELTPGEIIPDQVVSVESMVRTHGITYDRQGDLMILTDVASAESGSDGAFTVIKNYNTKAFDLAISENEQIIIEGPMSLLGNPVDIAYDRPSNRIYIAERAKDGGRVLGFDMPETSGDATPVFNESFGGASAIYLSNLRLKNVVQPEISIFDPNFSNDILVASRLTGGNEVPAVVTDAVGVATVTFDKTYTKATINVTVSKLSSAFMGMHIHRGNADENGPVVFDLSGSFTSGRATTTIDLMAEDVEAMINGNYYINIHTANHPAGEVRGQLTLESAETFSAMLRGSNEVPAVNTTALGLASVVYTSNTNTLELSILASDLSGPVTGIHLHRGAQGTNGPVVENLESYLVGNTVISKIKAGDYITELRNGDIYVNIHTEAYPGGEIRGQLQVTEGLYFDTWLDGKQEVPSGINDAIGFGMGRISSDLTSLQYAILIDNGSGPVISAHIHRAPLASNGEVVVDLHDDISGQLISKDSITISPEFLDDFLSGDLYFNVHTEAAPAGEVRGQIYRIARDGYVYDLCQDQEVIEPQNAGITSGSGMFAFNRDYDEAHFMAVVNQLSSTFAGAHIHNGEAGQNGPVVFDFSSRWNNNGSFFYITDEFNGELASIIQDGKGYVNIHTSNNPGGEVRGQIVKTPECPFSSNVVDVNGKSFEVILEPNPVLDIVTISFEGNRDGYKNSVLEIRDITGRLMTTKTGFSDKISVNILDYTTGIYLFTLRNNEYSKTIRVVKK